MLSWHHIHIAMKFHSDIPYHYRVRMHTRIVCKKTNQRAVTQKLGKGKQPFLYMSRRLDLIHIAMKFHQTIPYGYLVMTHTRKVCKITNQRAETKKGRATIFVCDMLSWPHTHYPKVSSKYSLRLPSYGSHKNCLCQTDGLMDSRRHNITHPFFSKWAYKILSILSSTEFAQKVLKVNL